MSSLRDTLLLILTIVLLIATYVLFAQASAHEDGSDPDAVWFQSLANGHVNCCNTHDCHRTEAWKVLPDGRYAVEISGKWVSVDPQNVLRVENPTGMAVECHFTAEGGFDVPYIRCFIPPVGV